MITIWQIQQEIFSIANCYMICDVMGVIALKHGSLDDNKMITNDNIFAKFGNEIFFIIL